MAIGAAIGACRARTVQMTGMPQLVALLHSFVGIAAVLVGFNSYLERSGSASDTVHDVEIFVGVFIGAVTFTGSIVANLKLSARMKSAPLVLPGRHLLNLGLVVVSFVLLIVFVVVNGDLDPGSRGAVVFLLVMTVLALALGLPPGGGDRRRRHARRRLDAQQLLGLGRGRRRLPARATTCSSSPARWWGPPVRSSATSCARP